MEQPPGYVPQGENKVCRLKSLRMWFEKFNITISGIDFHRCHSDHSAFVRRIKSGIIVLVVYVDNILLTGSDPRGLLETKEYLKRHFMIKNMGRPRYFLGIENCASKT